MTHGASPYVHEPRHVLPSPPLPTRPTAHSHPHAHQHAGMLQACQDKRWRRRSWPAPRCQSAQPQRKTACRHARTHSSSLRADYTTRQTWAATREKACVRPASQPTRRRVHRPRATHRRLPSLQSTTGGCRRPHRHYSAPARPPLRKNTLPPTQPSHPNQVHRRVTLASSDAHHAERAIDQSAAQGRSCPRSRHGCHPPPLVPRAYGPRPCPYSTHFAACGMRARTVPTYQSTAAPSLL